MISASRSILFAEEPSAAIRTLRHEINDAVQATLSKRQLAEGTPHAAS
jgi:hypothetical protein